jgi:hypothetical protein
MREFLRLVHPDVSSGQCSEAREANSNSLKELNAFLDRLSSTTKVKSPFVSRSIQFFTPIRKRDGTLIDGSARPFDVTLPSIPPDADLFEKRALFEQLLQTLKQATDFVPSILRSAQESRRIHNILSSSPAPDRSNPRDKLNLIWRDEVERNQIRDSIYASREDDVSLREYRAILEHNKLVQRYSKISHAKKRQKKLKTIPDTVFARLVDVPIKTPSERTSDEVDDIKMKLILSGYHPDLVFFRPHLSDGQRNIGLAHVCGENLETESQVWLLENVWDAMRKTSTPSVPLVLSDKWDASLDGAYIEVPFDFNLNDLVDFLEDNLEPVRIARKNLLGKFSAAL